MFFLYMFIFILIIILAIYFANRLKDKEIKIEQDTRDKFISQMKEKLKEINFKSYTTVADRKNEYVFFISKEKEEIFFCNAVEKNFFIFKFKDIVDFEIIEDKNVVFKNSAGGMIAGGLLYGGIGALAGSNIEKKVIEKSFLLKIKIYFDNIDCPEINMKFLTKEVKRSSYEYLEAKEDMEKFASTLKVVTNNKHRK